MNGNLINRYIWIVDTLTRYGALTLAELNELWVKSPWSNGEEMARRTFFHYRRAIEDSFKLEIKCNSAHQYTIAQSANGQDRAFVNWMLDSFSANSVISDMADKTKGRVVVEEVPSAREFLPQAIEAIRESVKIRFTYAGFSRSRPEKNILFRPYFVRLYKQRWYMIGLKESAGEVRTYALDRVREMTLTPDRFSIPDDADPHRFFEHLVGITQSRAEVKTVLLRTDLRQAKYLRALPLHHSQREAVNDGYSVFTYRVKLNYELVHEILSMGPAVNVLAPRELQVMITDELKRTLSQYED